MTKKSIGIDIGGTFLKYAIVDETMTILKKWQKPSVRFYSKDEFYDYLCQDLLSEDIDLNQIDLIGVSAPGMIDEYSNILSYAADNVLIMFGTNVNEEISRRTEKFVATMNDAKAAGYCEFRLGNGKHTKRSVYYLIGTGIGGCVCDEHGVIDGKDHVVGEFSYLPMGYDEKGNYVMHTLKASMDSLIQQYNEIINQDMHVKYGKDIVKRYLEGEENAKKAISQWLDHICYGIITITILYNPDIICIGGGISEESWFIESLSQRFQQKCFEHFRGSLITTKIDRCLYGNDANILGAVSYAYHQRDLLVTTKSKCNQKIRM